MKLTGSPHPDILRAAAEGETTKSGVLGCGRWGVNYVRVFGDLAGSRAAACADPFFSLPMCPELREAGVRRTAGLLRRRKASWKTLRR